MIHSFTTHKNAGLLGNLGVSQQMDERNFKICGGLRGAKFSKSSVEKMYTKRSKDLGTVLTFHFII